MSYFDSKKEDPWGSAYGSSVPAYSFSAQPETPQPAFAAAQPEFGSPIFSPQPEGAGANQSEFRLVQPDFK